ncbi:hypothetical protein AB0H83_19610 [Dactylosporangium sp. NPDC050688]|uniref:hypothetical protein n=1 Tax=Dactylosporangium sp. NPDC050688 TaxID=3157217 RepID=UPI0033C173D4
MRTRVKVLLVVGVCGALAAGVALWALRPDPTRVPIDSVAVEPNTGGRTLRVGLTYSSCLEFDRLTSDETGGAVRLTAYAHDRQTCGTAPTTTQVVTVRLERPLWDRPVVDALTGRPLTVAS